MSDGETNDSTGAGYHVPVMLEEVLRYLRPVDGLYFDGTVGGGGHSEAILEAGAAARLVGVDRDPEALEVAHHRLARFGDRVKLLQANFAEGAESVTRESEPLAGALLDLGISSRHIDAMDRGFSFRPGTPLDMRMAGPSSSLPTAAELLNTLPEAELAEIFWRFGEERRSRRLAAEIVKRRASRPLETSDDLIAAMERSLDFRAGRLDAQDKARIFQALRIAVNGELAALERALPVLRDGLRPEGVIVVLSYHSLEDRLVKDAFREWSRSCICPPELPICMCRGVALGTTLTRKPLSPSPAEVESNPRARSARLRAWRKAA